MHEVDRSVLVEYSAEQIYTLVERVEEYPQFLPWCGGTVVEARDEAVTRAAIIIDFKGIKQRFTTANAKQWPRRIDMRLVNGPFKSLDGAWHFHPLAEEACKVQLILRYEFTSRLLEKVVGPVFEHIATTFVDAFVKRAGQVYGPR
ncbi:MAG: type II toxin-antitoxin system RatA family toxin [Betaproteobacteria bacterium]|nr:type II toxin-antitoxin system RatA family toxin [Betaproteobacteria bacterium]